MNFHATLENATDIKRNADGSAWSWKGAGQIAEFSDPVSFGMYVEEHISELASAVAFTGSASMILRLNAYLAQELIKAGVIDVASKEAA